MKRVALYYRVSTDDQTTEPQRMELLDYCQRRGWVREFDKAGRLQAPGEDGFITIVDPLPKVAEYSDKISGAKFTRGGLDRLMADVRARRLDAVICVKMDRLGRSLPHLAQLISEFDANGVALICTSQGIDTSMDNPAGRLQMHVLMAVADFERSLIRERTRAGLEAARARGSVMGRPKFKFDEWKQAILDDYLCGEARLTKDGRCEPIGTLKKLAAELGCSLGKAHALVKEAR